VSLAVRKSGFVSLGRFFRLPRYGKDAVMNVDGHVLLLHAWQIEYHRRGVRFIGVMDVHPIRWVD